MLSSVRERSDRTTRHPTQEANKRTTAVAGVGVVVLVDDIFFFFDVEREEIYC
jgi:hypothetical protein